MDKIMFSDRFGLTAATIAGLKTQTRRIIHNCVTPRQSPFVLSGIEDEHGYEIKPRYKVGQTVAMAQCYRDAGVKFIPHEDDEFGCIDIPANMTAG